MNLKSLKTKIILSCTVCILIVGVFGNLYVYYYLTGILEEKADNIDRLNLNNLQSRMTNNLDNLVSLGNLCESDENIRKGISYSSLVSKTAKQKAINAQNMLNTYLLTSDIKPYVKKLIAFNDYDIAPQAIVPSFNSPIDASLAQNTKIFKDFRSGENIWVLDISKSIVDGKDSLVFLGEVYGSSAKNYGWVYLEMQTEALTDLIKYYPEGSYFITDYKNNLLQTDSIYTEEFIPDEKNISTTKKINGKTFKINSVSVYDGLFTLHSCSDISYLTQNDKSVFYTFLIVTITSLTIAIFLTFSLSGLITKPLKRLTLRIKKISENDFSFDPSIEKGNDEIAETGKMVNKVSASFQKLLKETEEIYVKQKNSDIALLQSQVNPHFLYNTLDSINWMATIQKNTGIETVTKNLSNLLKNLAKGVEDRIPIKEELSLLNAYIEIQNIRYMGTFELVDSIDESFYDYRIIKFTLQPLIENAIFHGIEPKGTLGTITLKAEFDGDYILIIIEDDGVGMTDSELQKLMNNEKNPFKSGLSGIGVSNVNNRLRLNYGEECGLVYESLKNVFTRVTLKIPKERV